MIIIGGGPAGLSAALSLRRARRQVIVVDQAQPRNRTAPHMHGVLGHDGLPPLELLEKGRTEVAKYGVRVIVGNVISARADEQGVEVTTADGVIRARHLIVATGLTDELPEIPGLRDQWGTGAVVCPYCDGWEHRRHVIGVIATSSQSVGQAQLLRQWSDRVVYFANVVGEPDEPEADALARRDIRVERGAVVSLVTANGRLEGVHLEQRTVPVDVVFTGPALRPNDALLRSLGATTTDGPLGSWIEADRDGRTSVPRVWATGDVVDPRANVSVSLGLGTLTAGAVNTDLVHEDIEQAPSVGSSARPSAALS
ncbi:NAD(P)/FAD-dependent oxidoreductase [Agromyces endophyticus]|uniref:NAD(P)/FAD-dependent oxidoreductase n=1 Tax=Agromyces sp. H17E-10 TaxID=2932244 RepID=UPI001FD6219F|nr:NAD(P)/FAD-dependent oxidoreductase [Agromyces sp. H17E-10]UOQ88150.1 NAD(P)/FAD-dependent oxidoreductase [Agromyces sp. H17E-10]